MAGAYGNSSVLGSEIIVAIVKLNGDPCQWSVFTALKKLNLNQALGDPFVVHGEDLVRVDIAVADDRGAGDLCAYIAFVRA
jgi:hypothetical protein